MVQGKAVTLQGWAVTVLGRAVTVQGWAMTVLGRAVTVLGKAVTVLGRLGDMVQGKVVLMLVQGKGGVVEVCDGAGCRAGRCHGGP